MYPFKGDGGGVQGIRALAKQRCPLSKEKRPAGQKPGVGKAVVIKVKVVVVVVVAVVVVVIVVM